ncbi:MAG: DUF4326 domain-containing protein [Crinalium sp.]
MLTSYTINVLNGYKCKWQGYYIGRANQGRKGSALANPFKLKDPKNEIERAEVIEKYRQWLWQQIQSKNALVLGELEELRQILLREGTVSLLCYCSPNLCHGDVIKACLIWIIENNV